MAKLRLDDELGRKIVDLIKAGNFAKVAAQRCGINEKTFYDWMNQGEKAHTGIFRRFYEAVKKAEAVPHVEAVSFLHGAMANGDVGAIKFYLERKYPDMWGAQKTVNLGNVNDKPFQVVQSSFDLSKMNDNQLLAYEKYLETITHDQSPDETNDESDPSSE